MFRFTALAMESAKTLDWIDGLPGVWKMQEGEKPAQALDRFFQAMDEKLPESQRGLVPFYPIYLKTKEARSELDKLERDYEGKSWEEERCILQKRNELRKLENKEIVAVKLLTKKSFVAMFWKLSGLLDSTEANLVEHRLSGGVSREDRYEELKLLKNITDSAKLFAAENLMQEEDMKQAVCEINHTEEAVGKWIGEWKMQKPEDTENFISLFLFFLLSGGQLMVAK